MCAIDNIQHTFSLMLTTTVHKFKSSQVECRLNFIYIVYSPLYIADLRLILFDADIESYYVRRTKGFCNIYNLCVPCYFIFFNNNMIIVLSPLLLP